uniref:Platelet endothelial cell adhesion molecule n=1 Tax=Canis lupus familiaris TaxID=9615 RepID=A0A8P0TSR4_CANLF
MHPGKNQEISLGVLWVEDGKGKELSPCHERGLQIQGGFIWATWEVPSAPGAWPKGRTNCPKFTLKMQLEWTQEGKMWLGALLILLLCPSLEGQENSFTINDIHMEILPGEEVQNGENMTLQCIVDISTTSHIKPQHWVLFYKDDVLFHNVSSVENTESYFIPRARVYDAGTYKCTVILNNKEKTSLEYQVWVKESFSNPKFHVSPEGVITEGDQLYIRCTIQVTHLVQAFPEIIIQKDKAIVAHKRHGNEATYSVMAMAEHNGNYTCKVEASRISKVSSIVVNITELFSKPKLESSITRLDQGESLNLWCSIPEAPPANFTIQKENTIVSQSQNFTKIASATDSGTYTCNASMGKVVKRSSAVQITVCEMLSKPRIFYDSSSEVIKGQTIAVSCQSINGTTPISYHLLKTSNILESRDMSSNEPAVFKDNPTKDTEYQCIVDNCHSHSEMVSEVLRVKVIVFLAAWIKGLIAVVVIGVIIGVLILGARCYILKKAKAKQTPVEMSRPAVPLLNSTNEKMLSDPNTEVNRHYGYNEDVGNHAMKPINENKEPLTLDVEYTEVEVTSPEPYQGLETKGTETVYSEIRKANPDFMENRYSRTEGSLDGT